MSALKTYIGDGVYADYDGYAVVLTTENGIEETNRIVLEPAELQALSEFFARINNETRTN